MAKHRKPVSGDRLEISADDWNEVLDSVAWVKEQRERSGAHSQQLRHSDPCIVQVKNTSGAARARFSVLGIDPTSIFPSPQTHLGAFKNGPVVRGITPTVAHKGRFVILQRDALVNDIVPGVILGTTVAKVDIIEVTDTHAEVQAGNTTTLLSASSGSAKILYQPEYPGQQWTLILIGGGGSTDLSRVLFQIQSFDDYTGLATCVPKYVPCSGELPGLNEDGTISVSDPAGCNFNEPPDELIGRWGWADWLINAEYPIECLWVCSGLCCPPIEPLAE